MRIVATIAAVLALSACPTKDIFIVGTPLAVLPYPWLGDQCERPSDAEVRTIERVWEIVTAEAKRLQFTTKLSGRRVRICVAPGPGVRCSGYFIAERGYPDGVRACAGTGWVGVARTGPHGELPIWNLMAHEMIKHLIASAQTVIPWETPDILPDDRRAAGEKDIVHDNRFIAVELAVHERMKAAGIPLN